MSEQVTLISLNREASKAAQKGAPEVDPELAKVVI